MMCLAYAIIILIVPSGDYYVPGPDFPADLDDRQNQMADNE